MLATSNDSAPATHSSPARSADSRPGSRRQIVQYNYRARAGARRRAKGKPASVGRLASDAGFWLFDGIDHPLRIKQGATTAYYELDLAGNVRALRGPSGANLGGYRYTAFGQTLVDTTTVTQSLRWKGRWHSNIAGGIHDVRARQWAPEIGVFASVDEYVFHDSKSTLWGWPRQSPVRVRDPMGRQGMCTPEPPDCVEQALSIFSICTMGNTSEIALLRCTWLFWEVLIDCWKNPHAGPPPPPRGRTN